MKEELSSDIESYMEKIKLNKEAFRQHQRNLPFGEKMQMAFSLAECDKSICHTVLLHKTKKEEK